MRARTRLLLPALVAVVGVVAAACDDGGTSANDLGRDLGERVEDEDRAATACTLLEPGEVEDELGGPVSEGDEQDGVCRFTVGGDQGEPGSGTLDVSLPAPSPTLEPAVWFDSLRPLVAVEVSGVGDGAFYDPESASITAFAGGAVLVLRASLIPEPGGLQRRLTALARAATDRLEA